VPRTAVILLATTDATNQSPASNTTRYCSTVNGRPRCCCHLLIRMRISTTCQILSVVYHELEVPLKTAPSPGRTHGSLGQPESTNHMQRDQFSHLCRAHSCVQQTDRQTDHATSVTIGCIYVCTACMQCGLIKKGKGSPYSITEHRVPELIPVLGSQPAGDASCKPSGRLPLLSARPAVTLATLNRAATNFAAW